MDIFGCLDGMNFLPLCSITIVNQDDRNDKVVSKQSTSRFSVQLRPMKTETVAFDLLLN